AERIGGGDRRHVLSAYLTFVATGQGGRPRPVPPLLPGTDIEQQRYAEAELRRSTRLQHARELEALRGGKPA
ncbi:MAG TPA: acyl-CoA thioesterase, partial [Candidatus Binatia bacterium]|nr:acyl-CoA thioesterase [Candidatus Binatia bacterium]